MRLVHIENAGMTALGVNSSASRVQRSWKTVLPSQDGTFGSDTSFRAGESVSRAVGHPLLWTSRSMVRTRLQRVGPGLALVRGRLASEPSRPMS